MFIIGFGQLLGLMIPIVFIILMFFIYLSEYKDDYNNQLPNWIVGVLMLCVFIFGVTWGSILF